jgi:hypothetical protein
MLEEAYGNMEMKKTLVYRWHKCGHVSVDDRCCWRLKMADAQGLIRYEFIPEGHTVNKEMYIEFFHHFGDAVSAKKVIAKRTRALTEVLKMVSSNASKSFTNVGKSVSQPKGTALKAVYVNRCKVTCFCVINQFWERFEGLDMWYIS